jgi:PAS domain-containing protein
VLDAEEEILDASGKKWRSTTKVPLFDDKNEVFALVGISRDITALKAQRAVANELISLQALIDFVPDYLWVKDTESRFLVANKAITIDNGRTSTSEVIGQSDFDFHAPEIAREFRADELEILRSGKPMIDKEEYVIEAGGITKWLLQPRCRSAMRTMKSSVSSALPATLPNVSAQTDCATDRRKSSK